MRFSVVMPINNEEQFLPHSLPSILSLEPDEVLLLFDRCIDGSFQCASRIIKKYNYQSKVKLKVVWEETPREWVFRVAWLRRTAFLLTSNDLILNTDADIILNPRILKYFPLLNKHSMISFGRLNVPYSYPNLMALFITNILGYEGFTGTYVFSKKAWLKTDELETVKSFVRAEDTHMRLAHGNKYKFCKIYNYNLRPTNTKYKGELKHSMLNQSLWKVIGHTILYHNPNVLQTYLQSRAR